MNTKTRAHILERIFPLSKKISDDFDTKRKMVMLYIISTIAIAALIPLGIVAYNQNNKTLGFMDHTVAVLLAVNLLFIARTGKIKTPSIVGTSIAGILFVYLFQDGNTFTSTAISQFF